MTRRLILVISVIAAALVAVGVAQARLPNSARELRAARLHHHPLPARTQLRLASHTIRYGTATLRFLRQHPHAGTYRGRQVIAHNHSWLIRFGAAERREAIARIDAAAQAAALAALPPHYNEWLCIHRYEGSWDDPGAPYYGGLQMDWGFMRAYGGWLLDSKGTADNWTPLEQMWVAERAYRAGRGFYPWPNTAHYCGLI